LTITSGATPLSFVTNSNLVVQAALAGTGGVRKLGAGTLTLTGNYGNTGGLTLSGGVLAASGAALNLNGALAVPNITFQGGKTTAAVEFTNTGSTTVATFNGSANIANDFRLTLSNVISTFTNGTNDNQTTTLSGVISGGSATGTFRVSGNGNDSSVFVLTNPNNSFTGTVSIFEGVLAVASNGALGNAANSITLNTTSTTGGGLRLDANFTGGNALARNFNFADANFVNTNGNDVEATGVVSGTGAFTKSGAGTLVLANNANTHTGLVNVNAGSVLVNGNIAAGTNAVTVNSGGTLGGTGIINRPVVIASGGTLAPGASIGTLTVTNDVTINGNPTIGGWDIELNAVPANTPATAAGAPDVDILALTGSGSDLNLVSSAGNPLRISLTAQSGTFDFGSPVSYVIATADSGANFQFNGAAFSFDPTAYTFNPTNFFASDFTLSIDGNRLLLSFNPVPEPGVWVLASVAAVGGLGWKRLRRTRVG
jgi:autotransporter-associated beta strand protein